MKNNSSKLNIEILTLIKLQPKQFSQRLPVKCAMNLLLAVMKLSREFKLISHLTMTGPRVFQMTSIMANNFRIASKLSFYHTRVFL